MPSHSFTVTHASGYPNWRTENALFDALDREFYFACDAAATRANCKVPLDRTSCPYFGPDMWIPEVRDALAVKDWNAYAVTSRPFFCNPPSSRDDGISLAPWVEMFTHQALDLGATIVGLIPYKPSESWWRHTRRAVEVREIPHRVRYWIPEDELAVVNAARAAAGKKPIRSGDTAGFSSAVVIWRPQPGIQPPATPRVVTWTYRDAAKLPDRP